MTDDLAAQRDPALCSATAGVPPARTERRRVNLCSRYPNRPPAPLPLIFLLIPLVSTYVKQSQSYTYTLTLFLFLFLSRSNSLLPKFTPDRTACLERIFAMRVAGQPAIQEADIASIVGPLLTNLFAALSNPKHTENDYFMKCMGHCFYFFPLSSALCECQYGLFPYHN